MPSLLAITLIFFPFLMSDFTLDLYDFQSLDSSLESAQAMVSLLWDRPEVFGHSLSFEAPWTQNILHVEQIVGEGFCGFVGVHVPPLVACRVMSSAKETRKQVQGSMYQLTISKFNELCVCCLWKWGPFISFWTKTFCPITSLNCLGISMGSFQLTTEANTSQAHHQKPYLIIKDGHLRLHISITMNPHQGHCHRLQEVSPSLSFHNTSPNDPKFQLFLPSLFTLHPFSSNC